MMPSSSSKNFALASAQPPKSLVDRVERARGRERVGRVVGTLDLGQLDAVDDRAEAGLGVVGLRLGRGQEVEEALGGVRRRPQRRRPGSRSAACRRGRRSRTARRSAGPGSPRSRRRCSTSPLPSENAVVASRADGGRAMVFSRSLVMYSSASASLPPAPTTWAQAARMFHFAEPDEAGFGRDDLDAGLDQVVPALDVLGVALTDHEGHDRGGDDALGLVVLPVLGDQAGVDETLHVGLEGEVHDVGVEAALDGAALVAGGAVRRLEGDALAVGGPLELLEDGRVGRLEHGEADQAELVAARVGAATGARAGGQGEHAGRAMPPRAALNLAVMFMLSLAVQHVRDPRRCVSD